MRRLLTLTLALCGALSAQSLTSTTTTGAVTPDSPSLQLASTTGAAVGYELYVDREAMIITAVGSGAVTVKRGQEGTAATSHLSGSMVYVGPSRFFSPNDLNGSGCTSKAAVGETLLSVRSGSRWTCQASGVWLAAAVSTLPFTDDGTTVAFASSRNVTVGGQLVDRFTGTLGLRAKLGTGGGTIAFIGDSIPNGTGATDSNGEGTAITGSWPNQVVTHLQQAYGRNGPGFCSTEGLIGCSITFSGVWTAVQGVGPSQTINVAFSEVKTGANGATASMTTPYGIDTIDVAYYNTTTTNTNACSVSIDGGAATTFGAAAATPTPVLRTFGSLSAVGTHTIVLTSDGTCNLFGFNFRVNNGGPLMWNAARGSATSDAFSTADKVSWLGIVPNLALIVVSIGANDIPSGFFTPAQNVANLAAIQSKAAALGVPVLMVMTEPSSFGDLTALYTAQKAFAAANGYPWVSIFDRWVSYAVGNALGLYSDGVHPSQAGHNDIAEAVGFFLSPRRPGTTNGTGTWNFPGQIKQTTARDTDYAATIENRSQSSTAHGLQVDIQSGNDSTNALYMFRGTNSTIFRVTPRRIQLSSQIFSAIPACASGTSGSLALVTDSTTTTYGATITGSGSNTVLAFCNGTNWTVH